MIDRQLEQIIARGRVGARHDCPASIERRLHELQVRVVRRGVEAEAAIPIAARSRSSYATSVLASHAGNCSVIRGS